MRLLFVLILASVILVPVYAQNEHVTDHYYGNGVYSQGATPKGNNNTSDKIPSFYLGCGSGLHNFTGVIGACGSYHIQNGYSIRAGGVSEPGETNTPQDSCTCVPIPKALHWVRAIHTVQE